MGQFTQQVSDGVNDGRHITTNHGFSNTFGGALIGNNSPTFKGLSLYGRFINVTIPQGATINSAKLIVTAGATRTGTVCKGKIQGDDADDAAEVTDHTAFDAIIRTTASVTWDPIPTMATNDENDSPDIASVIQEIIDRPGWASGNAMTIILQDDEELSDGGAFRDIKEVESILPIPIQIEINFTEVVADIGGAIEAFSILKNG